MPDRPKVSRAALVEALGQRIGRLQVDKGEFTKGASKMAQVLSQQTFPLVTAVGQALVLSIAQAAIEALEAQTGTEFGGDVHYVD